jgi:hypothetical protein
MRENEMSEIQIGTSVFEENDFLIAVQDMLSCGDCRHCQQNKRIPDRQMDWTCYHEKNEQHGYYKQQPMNVSDNFLCINFELFDE